MSTFFIAVAIVAVVWGVVSGMLIFHDLRRRGQAGSFLWIRLMLPIHVHRYSVITRQETGRSGPLFYHFVVAFNVALVAVLLAAATAQL